MRGAGAERSIAPHNRVRGRSSSLLADYALRDSRASEVFREFDFLSATS